MLILVKRSLHSSEAKPPPPPLGQPLPQTFHLDPPLPTSTAPSRHFGALWVTLSHQMALQGATWSYHGTYVWSKVVTMSQSTSQMRHLGSVTSENTLKHIQISLLPCWPDMAFWILLASLFGLQEHTKASQSTKRNTKEPKVNPKSLIK